MVRVHVTIPTTRREQCQRLCALHDALQRGEYADGGVEEQEYHALYQKVAELVVLPIARTVVETTTGYAADLTSYAGIVGKD